MSYIFKGRLCGYICEECFEPLSNVKVRLYRTRQEQNVAALAVASPKDTFAILSDEDARAKQKSLLGEFETNAAGEFTAELSEKSYNGEAFEIDVYCGNVPHRKPTPEPPKPLQFSVTVVQPLWRRSEKGLVAVWEHCLSQRYWCLIRSRFAAWAICGRVLVCDTNVPVPRVKVSAFDVDWLQDDALGSAVTDANGKFRIDYAAADFKKDIFGFNIELFGGPDLYFKIESLGGDSLLAETPADGRKPGRENVGPCFCVTLCVEEVPIVTHAWFTRIGDFDIENDIDSNSGTTKYAVPAGFANAHGGPDYGFFGNMDLVGDCPVTYPGTSLPMRYRFRYEVEGSGTGLLPINSANIATVVIGDRPIQWAVTSAGPVPRWQEIQVGPGGSTLPVGATPTPSGPGPWGPIPRVTLGPDSDGWILVDQQMTNGAISGTLLQLRSDTIVPGGAAAIPLAGQMVTDPKFGKKVSIVFEAEPVGGPTALTPTLTNKVDRVVINNWDDVSALDLAQFTGLGQNACSSLTDVLTIQYTTDHEFMKAWDISIFSAAAFPSANPVASGSTGRGAFGTSPPNVPPNAPLNISAWPACSYRVVIGTARKLTDGLNDDPRHTHERTFCKD
jgi:hypothetical protein